MSIILAPQVCHWRNVDEITRYYRSTETSVLRSLPSYVTFGNVFRLDAFDYKATVITHYYGARRPN